MKSAHSLHRSIIKSLTSAKLGVALMICLGALGSSGLTAPPAQSKPDKVTLIVKMAKGLTLAQAQAVVRGHGATLKASIQTTSASGKARHRTLGIRINGLCRRFPGTRFTAWPTRASTPRLRSWIPALTRHIPT